MMTDRRKTPLTTAAVLLIAFAGCSDSNDDQPPRATLTRTTPSNMAEPSSPSVATTPPSDTEIASEAASNVVRRYYAVLDQLRQNPDEPVEQLTTVAADQELKVYQDLIDRERAKGRHQIGETQIVKLVVQAVDLAASDRKTAPTVQIDVCYDVGEVDVVDAHGESVVLESRPEVAWVRHTVSNDDGDSDSTSGWLVVDSDDLEKAPCDGP